MVPCSALGDASTEETNDAGHGDQRSDAHPASRLAEDSDVAWVPSKGGDILLYPREGGNLVEHAGIGDAIRQEEEAIGPQAVVHGDAHDPTRAKCVPSNVGHAPDPLRKAPP